MTTYSQYDTTNSITDSAGSTWTCHGLLSDAIRYKIGSTGKDIAFETASNAPGATHVWRDDNSLPNKYPSYFSTSGAAGSFATSCADAQTIYMCDSNYANIVSFTSPQWQYSSANPAVTWTQPTQTTIHARNLQVQFTPSATGHFQVVDTTNSNHVHWTNVGSSAYSVGIQQTVTFKVHTDVGNNAVFQLQALGGNTPTNVGNTFTPATHTCPRVNLTWGTLDTSVPGGKVTINFTTGNLNQGMIYYDNTNGDEIEVIDSNNTSLAVDRFDSSWTNTLVVNPVFQPNEIGTTKTLKLRIRNTTYEKNAFHDFVVSGFNATTTSGSYTSPYQPQYSISNPVWAQQVGNVISIDWTETNQDGTHSVELWKSNGNSAISSSITGGPLSYTLQSTSDNGTYELRYNGNVVQNSTSNSYAYQTPGGTQVVNYTNIQWQDNIASGGTTVEVTFNYVNTTSTNQYAYLYIPAYGGVPLGSPNVLLGPHSAGTSSKTITRTDGLQNTTYYLTDTHNGHSGHVSTHTTPSYTPPPTYTAGALTYDSVAGTITSQISNVQNIGNNNIQLLKDGTLVPGQTLTANGQLSYTFGTTAGTTYGPFLFEVKLNGTGTAAQSLTQSHSVPTQPPPTQQPSVSYAPAKGGRKRRFPIISTQLFNRQRSVYSIGTTHHELAPQF